MSASGPLGRVMVVEVLLMERGDAVDDVVDRDVVGSKEEGQRSQSECDKRRCSRT